MQHGTDNEINAVSTLVSQVIPTMFPGMTYFEDGCIKLFDDFMIVSPDGTIGDKGNIGERIGIEFKCPTKTVHRIVPVRYYLQCLATMYAVDATKLLYISWGESITTVFEVYRKDDIFLKAISIAQGIYGAPNPKRPTKVPPDTNELRKIIKNEVLTARFLESSHQQELIPQHLMNK